MNAKSEALIREKLEGFDPPFVQEVLDALEPYEVEQFRIDEAFVEFTCTVHHRVSGRTYRRYSYDDRRIRLIRVY